MARPRKHWPMVRTSRDEAAPAVRLYSDPAEVRSFESFIIHMHLAWLYLLHAELTRDGVDYRHWRKDKPHLLEKVDGEPKRWDLARSVKKRWPDDKGSVRANILFFIRLRNRIEHRYAREQQAVAAAVSGHAQALLLNYEAEVTSQFGMASSMATRLRFPLFVGSFTTEGEQALRKLRKSLPAAVRTFLAEYDAGLDTSVTDDPRIRAQAPGPAGAGSQGPGRTGDPTYEIRRPHGGGARGSRRYRQEGHDAIGKKGMVVVKERQRDVVGHGLRKPAQVVKAVQEQVPYKFTMGHFIKAWKLLAVRPPDGHPHPERTDERYCIYFELGRSYGYKDAYARKLVRECSTEAGFRKLLGTAPKDKVTGEWVGEPPPNSVAPWARAKTGAAPTDEEQASA